MDKVTVVDNDFATLWYYPDKKVVHHQIHKYIYGEKFYEMLLAGTDQLKKNGANKWLSDDRAIPVIRKEDLEWSAKNWIPQTVAAGWKYWAIIEPVQPVGQMVMDSLMKQYSEFGIIARFFKDEETAMEWLDRQ